VRSATATFLSRLPTPLRDATFRNFYFGSVGVAFGYTMQATVAAWLMATLTPSPLMVALVQTASTAPTLLFGLIAGTLADIVDRRRILIVTLLTLFGAVLILGIATIFGVAGPTGLLVLTFVTGVGFTFYLPTQQASVNGLVSRDELSGAVALNAVAFNVARAAGPAVAGGLAAWAGTGVAFVAGAVAFTGMLIPLLRWKVHERPLPGVPERLLSGVRSGLRYARHSYAMRALIIRSVGFAVCASAFWALLPVIARDQLGLGAGGFGLLSAAFGGGAVVGALSIPRQLQSRPLNTIVTFGVALWTLAAILIAVTSITGIAVVGSLCAGVAWVAVLASLSAGTQSSAPAWVRARAVGMNIVAVQASLAVGSAAWGALASAVGTHIALAMSALLMAVLYLLYRRVRVAMGEEADVTTGVQLPEIALHEEPLPDDGPVLIQIEYQVDPENRGAFLRAIHAVEATRRRNGATSWRVFRDVSEKGRIVERFIIESWAEYMRLRARMTQAERRLQERVLELQRKDVPVRISRFLGMTSFDEEPDQREPESDLRSVLP